MHYASIKCKLQAYVLGNKKKKSIYTDSYLRMWTSEQQVPIRHKRADFGSKLNIDTLPFHIGINRMYSPLLVK